MANFSKKHRLYIYKFCADMINADLPLYESLLKLRKEGEKLMGKGFTKKLDILTGKMKSGQSIASVFENLIPRDELSVIFASERSGGLADGFLSLASIITYNAEIMKKIKSALTFPIIMLVLSFVVIAGYAVKVFPAFEDVIPVDKWPKVTQVLYVFGSALCHGLWIYLLLGSILIVMALRFLMANVSGNVRNNYLDRVLPFSTYKQITASVFLNNLSRMLANKIPINDSLAIIDINSNRWLRSHIKTMLGKMSAGNNYGDALNTGLFNPEVLLNIVLYSSLPSFNEVLAAVSDKSRENIQEYIEKLSVLLKSLATLALGGCVIWVFISLFALSDALSRMGSF